MPLLNPGLLTLMALKVKGRLRLVLRSVSTVRGALLTAFGAAVFAMFFLPYIGALFLHGGNRESDMTALWLGTGLGARVVALALLGYVLVQALLVQRGWPAFVKADIDFLFPAPVTRRQLLVQRLFFDLLVLMPTALIFGLFLSRATGAYLPAAAGIALAFFLSQLVMASTKLAGISERRWPSMAVWGVAAGVVGVAVFAFWVEAPPVGEHGLDWLDAVLTETSLRFVLPPFTVFTRAALAERVVPDLLLWGGAALLIDLLLAAAIVRFAPDFREAAIAASAQLHTRRRALQRGDLAAASGKPIRPWPSLPMPPRLGGAGPIVWRQLVSTLRNMRRLAFVLVVLGLVALPAAGGAWLAGEAGPETLQFVAVQAAVFGTLILMGQVRFDFRNDMDAMHWNKTMPAAPWRIVLGQLATPWLVVTAAQSALAAPVAVLTDSGWALAILTVLLPVNLLLLAMENTLYLLFPHVRKQFRAGDFQAMGRMYLFMLARLAVAGTGLGIAAGAGALAVWLTGSVAAGMVVGGAVVTAEAAGMVAATAWAFRRFDPSLDTPAD